ncbi:MAG: hypothetical protein M1125_04085 [Candidatus Marsarchaeota archaeon]|nr:hypothetical protein [Candidatus Marsarchaeota archaeon]
MEMLCEKIARLSVPAVRIAVSETLYNEYNMPQSRIAAALGIAQPAVYKYVHRRYSRSIGTIKGYVLSKGLHNGIIRDIINGKGSEQVSRHIEHVATNKAVLKFCSRALAPE